MYRLGNHQTVPNICQTLEVQEDAHRYAYQKAHIQNSLVFLISRFSRKVFHALQTSAVLA